MLYLECSSASPVKSDEQFFSIVDNESNSKDNAKFEDEMFGENNNQLNGGFMRGRKCSNDYSSCRSNLFGNNIDNGVGMFDNNEMKENIVPNESKLASSLLNENKSVCIFESYDFNKDDSIEALCNHLMQDNRFLNRFNSSWQKIQLHKGFIDDYILNVYWNTNDLLLLSPLILKLKLKFKIIIHSVCDISNPSFNYTNIVKFIHCHKDQAKSVAVYKYIFEENVDVKNNKIIEYWKSLINGTDPFIVKWFSKNNKIEFSIDSNDVVSVFNSSFLLFNSVCIIFPSISIEENTLSMKANNTGIFDIMNQLNIKGVNSVINISENIEFNAVKDVLNKLNRHKCDYKVIAKNIEINLINKVLSISSKNNTMNLLSDIIACVDFNQLNMTFCKEVVIHSMPRELKKLIEHKLSLSISKDSFDVCCNIENTIDVLNILYKNIGDRKKLNVSLNPHDDKLNYDNKDLFECINNIIKCINNIIKCINNVTKYIELHIVYKNSKIMEFVNGKLKIKGDIDGHVDLFKSNKLVGEFYIINADETLPLWKQEPKKLSGNLEKPVTRPGVGNVKPITKPNGNQPVTTRNGSNVKPTTATNGSDVTSLSRFKNVIIVFVSTYKCGISRVMLLLFFLVMYCYLTSNEEPIKTEEVKKEFIIDDIVFL